MRLFRPAAGLCMPNAKRQCSDSISLQNAVFPPFALASLPLDGKSTDAQSQD
jgi:hypothetical protein